MEELEIIGKRFGDPMEKNVTHIKVMDGIFESSRIIDWIDKDAYHFFTTKDGHKVPVKVATDEKGKKFLVSSEEGITPNYIEDLPEC